MSIVPVIMSGGAGTRLWPVSREGHPKPFIRLPDGQTLLGRTYSRAAALIPEGGSIMTVTNREYYFASRDQFAACNLSQDHQAHYLLEPVGRNTAAAIAHAALAVRQTHGDESIMIVMGADHLIEDTSAFLKSTQQAISLAHQGHMVTYGIRPTDPETGFGYIETGSPLDDQGACKVVRFVEKPNTETAAEYLHSGYFLWNSGIFCLQVGTLLNELQQHAPDILAQAEACIALSPAEDNGRGLVQELDPDSFSRQPDISIDYALMEHSARVAVVPALFDWSDIGSWSAMAQLVPADVNNNRTQGDTLLHNTRNTLVMSEHRLVAALGVDNLIIIDTDDALLIAHGDQVQEVGKLAKRLKQERHPAYHLHKTVSRPWGTYTVLEEGPRFKIKRIVVKPHQTLSLQLHHHRSEHWIVVQGMAEVINGDGKPKFINANESTFIAPGHQHRLSNPGVIDLVLIEVQSGEYLGEDDIVRLEDVYGRVK